MSEEIKVTVTSYGPGRCLMLRWTDPLTGKRKAKSAGTMNRKDALKAAGKLEDELRSGKYAAPSKITWQDFTWRYQDEVLAGLAQKTRNQLGTVFNAVERVLSPKRLADVTVNRLSHLVKTLRDEGKAEITMRNYLAHLKAAMGWAVGQKMLPALPVFPKLQRAKRQAKGKAMKGRPISGEEFERMLAVVPKVLIGEDRERKKRQPQPGEKQKRQQKEKRKLYADPVAVESWCHYLKGLWWSGLRLRESLELSWDRQAGLSVDVSGKFPMLKIGADWQKSGRDQLYPVAPEFGEMLLAVPEGQRRGRVFKLFGVVSPNGGKVEFTPVYNPDWVSRVVSRIGEAAKVKVDERTKRDPETRGVRAVVKYASAHDLRRSFGFRWSRRIMPAELKELMRHEDISTTMKFYVGQVAESTAQSLWTAYRKDGGNTSGIGNTSGNTTPSTGRDGVSQETRQALGSQGLVEYTRQDSNL